MTKLLIIMLLALNMTHTLKLNSQVVYKPVTEFKRQKVVNPFVELDPELKKIHNQRPDIHPLVLQPLASYTEGNSSDIQPHMFRAYPVERSDGKSFEYENPYDKKMPTTSSDNNQKLLWNFLV